jgi:hypothetical protein
MAGVIVRFAWSAAAPALFAGRACRYRLSCSKAYHIRNAVRKPVAARKESARRRTRQ